MQQGIHRLKIDCRVAHTVEYKKMSAGNSEFTAEFFDEASRSWMMNKKRLGYSMIYRCAHTISTGRQCFNAAVMTSLTDSAPYTDTRLCKIHINKVLKSNRKNGGKFTKNSLNGDAR